MTDTAPTLSEMTLYQCGLQTCGAWWAIIEPEGGAFASYCPRCTTRNVNVSASNAKLTGGGVTPRQRITPKYTKVLL
jgi:hypothetical protein